MIFHPDLAQRVMEGRKTVTRRLVSDNPRSPWWRERTIYQAGKVFAVQPGRGKSAVGMARVLKAERTALGVLTAEEAHREGFASLRQFGAAWSAMHGGYDTQVEVWRIEFEVVD